VRNSFVDIQFRTMVGIHRMERLIRPGCTGPAADPHPHRLQQLLHLRSTDGAIRSDEEEKVPGVQVRSGKQHTLQAVQDDIDVMGLLSGMKPVYSGLHTIHRDRVLRRQCDARAQREDREDQNCAEYE